MVISCKLNFRFCNLLRFKFPLVCFALCNVFSECQTTFDVVNNSITQIIPNHFSFCNHMRFGCFLSVHTELAHASLLEFQNFAELRVIRLNHKDLSKADHILIITISNFSGTSNYFLKYRYPFIGFVSEEFLNLVFSAYQSLSSFVLLFDIGDVIF